MKPGSGRQGLLSRRAPAAISALGTEAARRYKRPMRIYTRTGDDGTTGLRGGERISKADDRVEACGTLDEASSAIGLARALGLTDEVDAALAQAQTDLLALGAELASGPGAEHAERIAHVNASDVARLERAIDAAEQGLAPLQSFVLPGGCPAAAALHLARCIVRRAERRVVGARAVMTVRSELVAYLNRLSDLLFLAARLEEAK